LNHANIGQIHGGQRVDHGKDGRPPAQGDYLVALKAASQTTCCDDAQFVDDRSWIIRRAGYDQGLLQAVLSLELTLDVGVRFLRGDNGNLHDSFIASGAKQSRYLDPRQAQFSRNLLLRQAVVMICLRDLVQESSEISIRGPVLL
jgi:hypothetical protein